MKQKEDIEALIERSEKAMKELEAQSCPFIAEALKDLIHSATNSNETKVLTVERLVKVLKQMRNE